jgi:hypothetical protein
MATKIEIVFNQDLPEAELALIEQRVTKAVRGEAVAEVEVEGQHVRDFSVYRPTPPIRGPKNPGER